MPVAPEEVRRRPVGVFDSGVGGLTVLHELLVRLPHEDYVYLADSARLPYGSRAPAELQAFALEVAEELLARPGREREHVDLHVRHAPQGFDLVAHEDAALRRRGGRPHVRHHQRTHRAERTSVTHLSHFRHEHP